MAVTIYDIAKKAQVSYSTASRVLNGENYGKRSDSLKRAEKVLQIAKEMGYQPNSVAQTLAGKRARVICLSISDQVQAGWSNAYFAQVLDGVEQSCHKYDYGLVLNTYKDDDLEAFFTRRKLANRSFDGMVIAGYVTSDMNTLLRQHNIPFISANKLFDNKDNAPAYYADGSEYDIVRYAYKCGHRRIGFVTEDIYPDIAQIRRSVADVGMTDCQIIDLPIAMPGNLDSGPAAMAAYLQPAEQERPTLIAANYQCCAALLKQFRKNGLVCPDDISLISRCESEVCRAVEPEITVIAPNLENVGQVASEKLIDFLENQTPLKYECSDMPNIFIERQSVKIL